MFCRIEIEETRTVALQQGTGGDPFPYIAPHAWRSGAGNSDNSDPSSPA
jgi:hypothetical protein